MKSSNTQLNRLFQDLLKGRELWEGKAKFKAWRRRRRDLAKIEHLSHSLFLSHFNNLNKESFALGQDLKSISQGPATDHTDVMEDITLKLHQLTL